MILSKSLIFTWTEDPGIGRRDTLAAKLAEMATENKTDGIVHRDGLVHTRNFVDAAAAQEFVDFYVGLLEIPELPRILTVSIVDNV